jgi:hypothetical protein
MELSLVLVQCRALVSAAFSLFVLLPGSRVFNWLIILLFQKSVVRLLLEKCVK